MKTIYQNIVIERGINPETQEGELLVTILADDGAPMQKFTIPAWMVRSVVYALLLAGE